MPRPAAARALFGIEGAEPLASPCVLPGVCWLDHLSVAQASPRTTSTRALETKSSRRAPAARRRDAGRGTPASQSPEPTKSVAVRWLQEPLIGGGRSSGCDLASLRCAPATSSAAIPFDPMESGSFLRIVSDTWFVIMRHKSLSHIRLRSSRIVPVELRQFLAASQLWEQPVSTGIRRNSFDQCQRSRNGESFNSISLPPPDASSIEPIPTEVPLRRKSRCKHALQHIQHLDHRVAL